MTDRGAWFEAYEAARAIDRRRTELEQRIMQLRLDLSLRASFDTRPVRAAREDCRTMGNLLCARDRGNR